MVSTLDNLDALRYFLEEAERRARVLTRDATIPVVKSFGHDCASGSASLLRMLDQVERTLRSLEDTKTLKGESHAA